MFHSVYILNLYILYYSILVYLFNIRNLVDSNESQVWVEYVLKNYRSLQLIQRSFNDSLGKGFMPTTVFGLFGLSTTALFALISFYEELNSVAIIIIFVILIFTLILPSASFILSSQVNLASQELLKHLSEINSARIIKQKIKSSPPLRFFIGILFYVKPETVLTYFNILINNVITLILSFGK